jgi:hypothetical protein
MRLRGLAATAASFVVLSCGGSNRASILSSDASSDAPTGMTDAAPGEDVASGGEAASGGDGGSPGGDAGHVEDAASGADSASDGSSDDGTVTQRKRVFVTSATFPGHLDPAGPGLNGATDGDHLCQNAATQAGLGGQWRAWLQDASGTPRIAAADRLQDASPWYLVDRTTQVFATKAGLAMAPQHAIDITEKGAPVATGEVVWTGTDSNGMPDYNCCANWLLLQANFNAVVGDAHSTTEWTQTSSLSACDAFHHLYCFEQ